MKKPMPMKPNKMKMRMGKPVAKAATGGMMGSPSAAGRSDMMARYSPGTGVSAPRPGGVSTGMPSAGNPGTGRGRPTRVPPGFANAKPRPMPTPGGGVPRKPPTTGGGGATFGGQPVAAMRKGGKVKKGK